LNYLFHPANGGDQALVRLFDRIHDALTPGGFFVFDVAEPDQVTRATPTRTFSEGGNWVVLVEKGEDREHETLTRRIVTFRKAGECYRRTDEVHRLRLYGAADIADSYAARAFGSVWHAPTVGTACRKPARRSSRANQREAATLAGAL